METLPIDIKDVNGALLSMWRGWNACLPPALLSKTKHDINYEAAIATGLDKAVAARPGRAVTEHYHLVSNHGVRVDSAPRQLILQKWGPD